METIYTNKLYMVPIWVLLHITSLNNKEVQKQKGALNEINKEPKIKIT